MSGVANPFGIPAGRMPSAPRPSQGGATWHATPVWRPRGQGVECAAAMTRAAPPRILARDGVLRGSRHPCGAPAGRVTMAPRPSPALDGTRDGSPRPATSLRSGCRALRGCSHRWTEFDTQHGKRLQGDLRHPGGAPRAGCRAPRGRPRRWSARGVARGTQIH